MDQIKIDVSTPNYGMGKQLLDAVEATALQKKRKLPMSC